MRFFFAFGLLVLACQGLFAQGKHWQQTTHYSIHVTLIDSIQSLKGDLTLEYINHSPDTLHYIWMHLWPNAFKNDRTAFSEQRLRNGKTDFYFSTDAQKGYINQLNFTANNKVLATEEHPQWIDAVKVVLDQPLLPRSSVKIHTPFFVKLPYNFSRGGYYKNTFQITQWFPKAAMYDREGWHVYPYLDIGEYFSNFGNYDVTIELPKDYMVAATGELQTTTEKEWLLQKITDPATPNPTTTAMKTLHYRQDSVVDFAWFADSTWAVRFDTALIADKIVETWAFFNPEHADVWKEATDIIRQTLHFKSAVLGAYPYKVVTVAETPLGFAGGMEYPTITNLSSVTDLPTLRMLIKHEVGHNWFQAILATNERLYPWLDEGLNSYYDNRFLETYYQTDRSSDALEDMIYAGMIKSRLDQPVATAADDFTELNFSLMAYTKAAHWLKNIEDAVGQQVFDKAMQQYFNDWKFAHPGPHDFKKYFDAIEGFNSDSAFALLYETGPLTTYNVRKPRLRFFYSTNYKDYQNIFITPISGYNHYDKFMLGIGLHNYQVPAKDLNFLLMPLYSFSSGELNGLGRLSYTIRTAEWAQKLLFAVDVNKFSTRRGTDSTGKKIAGGYYRIAPSVRWVAREKSALSTTRKWIEWKTFFIGERGFNFQRSTQDGNFYPILTAYEQRYLNRLTLTWENNRALNPYDLQLQTLQGKDFVRLQGTYRGVFHYADKGKLEVRWVFTAFDYLGGYSLQKRLATQVYQPKLTASRGAEDVTYSDYFAGRNETAGLWGKQITERDGFFKLRTDLFSGLQGRSDEWITAVNLSTTLPAKIMPLRFVKLFLDIGTYADAWKPDAVTPNFLYTGGIQLSLIDGAIQVYAPVIYSKFFGDQLKTTPETNSFLKRVSFSFNIQRFNFQRSVKLPVLL